MDRWLGRIAVVTGASSGIGSFLVKDLANAGLVVVGLARRKNAVELLRLELPKGAAKRVHALYCDLTSESDIENAFKWIEEKFGGISILINNAGILKHVFLLDNKPSTMEAINETIQTNIVGLVQCSRRAINSMKNHNITDGHVIHVNSLAGHKIPMLALPTFNIYPATKHAVTAIAEIMRQELILEKSMIKVSSISPGVVKTEIFHPDIIANFPHDMPMLNAEDVSKSIIYMLSTPPHVQIQEMIILPTGGMY